MSFLDKLKSLIGGGAEMDGMAESDMISCEDAIGLVQEYLDGELEGVSHAQVKQHFEMCRVCYPHLRFEESFRDAVQKAASGEAAPPELKQKLIELLADAEK